MKRWTPGPLTIRVRLGVAMAIALLPVLVLGIAQSVISFNKEGAERRASLEAAAERTVANARSRLDSAVVVLETVTPGTVGVQCAPRLSELMQRMPGVVNLVRLDRLGRVACAADSVLGDRSARSAAPWFQRLKAGEASVMAPVSEDGYARQPALLVATRAVDGEGRFDGALTAFFNLARIGAAVDNTAPKDTQVALIDEAGRFLTRDNLTAFSQELPPQWRKALQVRPVFVFYGKDLAGSPRVFSITRVPRANLFAVLSAPSPSPFSWARLNLLSSVLFPLIAFLATLVAVWVAAERVIVRWLHYVERIAAIYAKGRFTVRPLQADKAPPEIRELAETLDAMAETIVARDASLRESLDHKDALMREIHHRVKNNLQVITSLLSLQQRAMSDPSAREAMSDTRQRITAMALIYRALYQGPDLRRVELRSFLEELIAQLVAADHHDGSGAIRTELHADDLEIHPDKLAPLALFAVEAISNAQKHAFHGRGGALRVTFRVDADEALLEIADDGPGASPRQLTAGVGRTLMNAFARQLHGQAEIVANQWGGLSARLSFPTPDTETSPPEAPSASAQGARGKRNRAAA